jgi:peptidoglycan/xylan/chitin deacetylase (PgdA/CDA1 family)
MSDRSSRSNLSRRLFRMAMTTPLLPECLAGFTSSEATIFMAHRFCVPEFGISGHDPQNLRRILAQLRKRRYDLVSIGEIFRRLREGEDLERVVAFTIDDGYYDVGEIAAPIFAEFDCPVTVFAVTDFVDGKIWLWWDKIAYIFTETKRVEIGTRLGKERFRFRLESDVARSSWRALVGRCYQSSEEDRSACIQELSAIAEVELPSSPPVRYQALSWDQARRLESRGISFGPHTLTHPILTTATAEQSEREITGSWRRLQAELSRPVPIFCYPGGESIHFGQREIATMGRIGLWGAVTGEPGNISSGCFQGSTDHWYRMPRFLYQDTLASVLQCVSGVETIKAWLREKLTRPCSPALAAEAKQERLR